MELFSLHCTTCKARLKVTDPSAIGQIVACPKCQSMVLVEPPPGTVMGGTGAATGAVAGAEVTKSTVAAKNAGPAGQPELSGAARSSSTVQPTPSTAARAPQPSATPAPQPAVTQSSVMPKQPAANAAGPAPREIPTPPPLPTAAAMAPSLHAAAAAGTLAGIDLTQAPVPASRMPLLLSTAQHYFQQYKLFIGGVGVGVALGTTTWLLMGSGGPAPLEVASAAVESPGASVETPDALPGTPDAPLKDAPSTDAPSTEVQAMKPVAETPEPPVKVAVPELAAPEVVQPPQVEPEAPAPAGNPDAQQESAPAAEVPLGEETEEPVEATVVDEGPADEATVEIPVTEEEPGAEPDEAPATPEEVDATDEDSSSTVPLADEVMSRLQGRVARLAFDKMPLRQFTAFVAQFSGVRIRIDQASLTAAGITAPRVTLRADDVTVEDLLRTALKDLGLSCEPRDGVLVIFAK